MLKQYLQVLKTKLYCFKNLIPIAFNDDSDREVHLNSLFAPQPTIAIVGSGKEKKQCVELGFVDKLIQLWR